MDASSFMTMALSCAPAVSPATALALARAESGLNPFAIGVVGGALLRQPSSLAEAVATANALQASGWNFSLGLTQINLKNLDRLRLPIKQAFDVCANLAAMQVVLSECFDRASRVQPAPSSQTALRAALSCYYSGNFTTGFREGYVRRVVALAAIQPQPTAKESP